jgi:hypothetical protein
MLANPPPTQYGRPAAVLELQDSIAGIAQQA